MFRKGGSAAEGTGITSGLRKKYQVGGFSLEGYPYDMEVEENENLGMNLNATANTNKNTDVVNPNMDMTREAYARKFGQNLERQMMPTYRDQVLDFLTAFGATGAAPGQYQTLSDALSKTGKNFQAIFDPKVQTAKKAGTQGYLSALKGADKENLLKYQRMAQDMARVKNISYDEALKTVLARELGDRDRSKDIIEAAAQRNLLLVQMLLQLELKRKLNIKYQRILNMQKDLVMEDLREQLKIVYFKRIKKQEITYLKIHNKKELLK